MTQLFRITHLANLPFILRNGLHSPESSVNDPNFLPIGFPKLIEYRKDRNVPVPPGGTLSSYIPFYFWFRSPMLYIIHKGNDPEVIQTPQEEIIYLVTSVQIISSLGCPFVFTDRHAKLDYAQFFQNIEDLDKLDWGLIRTVLSYTLAGILTTELPTKNGTSNLPLSCPTKHETPACV